MKVAYHQAIPLGPDIAQEGLAELPGTRGWHQLLLCARVLQRHRGNVFREVQRRPVGYVQDQSKVLTRLEAGGGGMAEVGCLAVDLSH